jgi:hypothetical protein
MPLEIRELVIKVTISSDAAGTTGNTLTDEKIRQLKDGIIKECIESILNRIQTEAER